MRSARNWKTRYYSLHIWPDNMRGTDLARPRHHSSASPFIVATKDEDAPGFFVAELLAPRVAHGYRGITVVNVCPRLPSPAENILAAKSLIGPRIVLDLEDLIIINEVSPSMGR